jgi:tetratricopeptide (TPR) repeat protein
MLLLQASAVQGRDQGEVMRLGNLAFGTMLFALVGAANAESAGQVFKQVSPSVVVVLTYDNTGKAAELGSGVKLPDGDVATNCHVLKDGRMYRVRYQGKDYPAQLAKSDWNHDVCALGVPGLPAPPVVLGNTKTLQIGAPVYAVGTPEGLQLTLSEGIVSSLRPVGDGSYIQTTAAISPGSSGGGLFDDQGRLLGLTSFFVSKGQQLNFALPVEWIEALPQHVTPRIAPTTSAVAWLNRAAALESKEDWQGLQALAVQWLKAQPNQAMSWVALGEADDGLGQYAPAIKAYRHWIEINPQLAEAWNNLGVVYGHSGRYSQAIGAYRHAIQIKPQYELAWVNLGLAYGTSGQYTQAIEADFHAILINPQLAKAWINLGIAYNNSGQYPLAIEAERHAIQIKSQNELAWVNLGLAYSHLSQYPQAIEAYRNAIQIKPQLVEAWSYLGLAYMISGQHPQAIEAERHAIQIKPQYELAWVNLGLAYGTSGQYTQAIEAERHAIQSNPQDTNAWYDLGLAYHFGGRESEALDVYQHLKSIDPEMAQKLFDLIVPK